MSKRQLSLIFIITFFSLLLFPLIAWADDVNTTNSLTPKANRAAERETQKNTRLTQVAENEQTRMGKLKTRALNEIDRRLKALNQVMSIVNGLKRLTTEEKSSLVSSIQQQINDLTSLRAKIAADTDLATLKTDTQSIVKAYRIFALFIPKVHIISAAEVIMSYIDKISNGLVVKLDTAIKNAKDKGQNTVEMERMLAEVRTLLDQAKSQAQNASNAVLSLQPADYPGNKTILELARKNLQAAKEDLKEARQMAKQIIQKLKEISRQKSSSTP